MELQVWRFNEALTQGEKVVGYVANVDIPQVPQRFQCINIELSQDEYMDVNAGDYLGVWMFPNNFLPVVKQTLDFRHLLYATPETFNGMVPSVVRFPTSPLEYIVSAEAIAIHLTADIAALSSKDEFGGVGGEY